MVILPVGNESEKRLHQQTDDGQNRVNGADNDRGEAQLSGERGHKRYDRCGACAGEHGVR